MTLQEVFTDELRDLYNAENQIIKALPKVAEGATSEELKSILHEHLEETKGQVERLKQIFDQLGEKPTGEVCKGMQGVLAEGDEQVKKSEQDAASDLAIVGGCIRVEHYEMAGYSTAIILAKALGESEALRLLTETLEEEKEAAKKLVRVTKPLVAQAETENADEDDEDEEEEEETEEVTA